MAVLCLGLGTRGSMWSVVSDAMMGGLGGVGGVGELTQTIRQDPYFESLHLDVSECAFRCDSESLNSICISTC